MYITVTCPYCGTVLTGLFYDPVFHTKFVCPEEECGNEFSVVSKLVAIALSPDEAQVMQCLQGMGYESGFSEQEKAIAKDLLEKGYVLVNEEGHMDKTDAGWAVFHESFLPPVLPE